MPPDFDASHMLATATQAEILLLVLLSLASTVAAVALHHGWLPLVRFQRAPGLREPPLWGLREVLLGLLLWYAIQLYVGWIVLALVDAGLLGEAEGLLTQQLAVGAVTAYAACWIVVRELGQPVATLGLAGSPLRNLAPAVVAWALSLCPIRLVQVGWLLALVVVGVEPAVQPLVTVFGRLVERGEWGAVVLHVVAGTLVAPVVEEILFRGLVFGAFRRSLGPLLGALAASLVFSAVHLSLSASVPLVVLGLVLCYVYERTGSLYPAIAFHAVFNGATYLLVACGAA